MGDEVGELDWLDAKLREEAPYIDDAGFTGSVMQKLPARRATRSLRSVILMLAAIFASAAAYLLSGGGRFIYEGFARAELFSPLTILIAALCVGVVMVGCAAYAAAKRAEIV